MSELESAWAWREKRGLLVPDGALRVFHGPGEGTGALQALAVEVFGAHAWVTLWEGGRGLEAGVNACAGFLKARGLESAVVLKRPERGEAPVSAPLFGEAPPAGLVVREGGACFRIRLTETRHPGLFLDHLPLREWLRANAKGLRVLNTFAYTGSLSVAAALGGASQVTTLDLSKPTLEWAKENWRLNSLPDEKGAFIAADFFEWVPRKARGGELFDCVILDPPSFSRGKKGTFSTAKDLGRLHEQALAVLAPGGFLATSINSANISRSRFEEEIKTAAKTAGRILKPVHRIDLPETFPAKTDEDRYLKGWVFRVN